MNWFEAYAFCIWDGGFLPSAAEWEYGAAGGSEGRKYPWGATDPGEGTEYAVYKCNYRNESGLCSTAPVGTTTQGAGRWGQLDMAGNVDEWNLNASTMSDVAPCTDCAWMSLPNNREMRGGYYGDDPHWLLPVVDQAYPPTGHILYTGVRCARAP